MVLGPTERLDSLVVFAGALVDRARDGRGADETDGVDAGVFQECFHRRRVALEHVENAVG